MNDNSNLERILHERHVPAASTNLAARIKTSAKVTQDIPFYQSLLNDITSIMIIPKPAYALAAMLVLGVFIGVEMNTGTDMALSSTDDLFAFADIEQGGWL